MNRYCTIKKHYLWYVFDHEEGHTVDGCFQRRRDAKRHANYLNRPRRHGEAS